MEKIPETNFFELGYRRSFDGLRGVAITFVVCDHASILSNNFGFIGVDLFFVLSGFLITCLLVEEWNRCGRISLDRFYIRRALRLLPALVVLLIAVTGYGLVTHQLMRYARVSCYAFFYSTNWVIVFTGLSTGNGSYLRHTWSLSIEEQFYLIWPAVLVFMISRVSRVVLLRMVFAAGLLFWVLRFILYFTTATGFDRLFYGTDTRADSLFLGCTVAMVMSFGMGAKTSSAKKYIHLLAMASVMGLFGYGYAYDCYDDAAYYWGWFGVSLCGAVIIMDLLLTERGVLHTFLSSAPLVYLGKLSYGLYLWHYPIFCVLIELGWPWWKNVIIGALLTIAATLGSYYWVEMPCQRWKKRFSWNSGISQT
jgi:peptidoglycan/LPS O-acetylase OafA/YrhL